MRPGRVYPSPDEIGCDGGEIVVRKLSPLAACRLVPGLAEFASAAQVRDNAGAAAFKPEFADRRVVVRRHRNPEATIAIKMNRRVARLAGGSHLHIRDARATRGAKVRQAGDYLPRPFTVGRREHLEYGSEIIEDR